MVCESVAARYKLKRRKTDSNPTTQIISNFFLMALAEKFKNVNFRLIYTNKYFLGNLLAGIFFNLAIWLVLCLNFKPQNDPIILHYNIYFGIDLIGPWHKIYLLPVFGLACFFINFLISVILYGRERLLSYFFIFISSLTQIILLTASIFLIFQNL